MDISSRSIIKVLSITTIFAVMLLLAWTVRVELIWVITAVLLATALNPWVERASARMPNHNRGLGVATVFIGMLLILVFLVVSFAPPLVKQMNQLGASVPRVTDHLIHGNGWISTQIRQFHLVDRIRESQTQIESYFSTAGGRFIDVLRSLFSGLIAGFTIFVLSIFMLLEGPSWVKGFWRIWPDNRRKHAQELADQMYAAITGYANGNLLMALLTSVVVSVMLMIVGIPYAIPLGLFVGIVSLLPLVGTSLGTLVVLAVSLFTSLTATLVLAIFFIIYQQLEGNVIRPLVFNRTVEISPLSVLVSVIIGTAALGILGALIAIPVFASLQILLKDYASHLFRR